MKIGPLPDSFVPKISDLWSLAFEQGDWVKWMSTNARLTHFGAYEGDELYACTSIYDFEARLAGKWIPCGGIAGVASNPARRGDGLVHEVMKACLQHLHEHTVPLAILGTSIPVFYERMGWAVTDWHYYIEPTTQSLEKFKSIGESRNFKMFPIDNFAACVAVHDKWCEQYNLSIRRSAERWKQWLGTFSHKLQFFTHPAGYMIMDLTQSEKDRKVHVLEWASLTDEAYYDGLALLAQLGSHYQSAVWLENDCERLFRTGMLPERPEIKMGPGQFSRVVHLDAFSAAVGKLIDPKILRDPLGVTADVRPDGITPGELVQLVTGFWKHPPASWPAELAGIAGSIPSFTCERF